MRKLILITALVLGSASAQAQPIDVGAILSAHGISLGNSGGQPQAGAMGQSGAGMQGAQQVGAAGQAGQGAAGAAGQSQMQGQSQNQSQNQSQDPSQAQRGKHGRSRESAQETRARAIAARYGISW